jgi:tRNA(Arg) A34 adenosine deaminase TadA
MCLATIHLARIGRLVFAASAETAAAFGFDARHLYDRLREPPALPTTQLLADEGDVALRLGARNAPPTAG